MRSGLRQGLVHQRKHTSVYETYNVIKEVGHGMTGKVYQVAHRVTGEKYALKCMEVRRIDSELLDDLRNEIGLLKLVDHPNVIKLYEFYEDEQNIFLILEYCDGGELFDRLHEQTGHHYSEREAASLVLKMCAAIAYCHRQGISHRCVGFD
jgi:serine/threonine protein kinase